MRGLLKVAGKTMRQLSKDEIASLKTCWDRMGVKYQAPISASLIEQFQDQNNVVLPADLLSFYSTFNGFVDDQPDDSLISFWPLQRVESVSKLLGNRDGFPDFRPIVNNLLDSNSYFVFAEFFCFSHVYAVRLSATQEKNSVIWIGSGDHFGVISDTFAEFITLYLETPDKPGASILKLSP